MQATGDDMAEAGEEVLAMLDREYPTFDKAEWLVVLGSAIIDLIAEAPDPAKCFEGQMRGMATYLEILMARRRGNLNG